MLTALRSVARSEPLLTIRLVSGFAALASWAATRYFDVTLDTAEIVVIAGIILGFDTAAAHQAVYSPATVDGLKAAGGRDVTHTERE